MMVNADIFVRDIPGQLVASLEPISLVDGNIVGVVHHRDNVMNGRIAVNVTFEVESSDKLENLKSIWKSRDVLISRIGSVVDTFGMEYMLIGDIAPGALEKLIEKAGKVVKFQSVDVRFSHNINSPTRTIIISAKTGSENDISKLNDFMLKECENAGIVYIRGIIQ